MKRILCIGPTTGKLPRNQADIEAIEHLKLSDVVAMCEAFGCRIEFVIEPRESEEGGDNHGE